jgi:hypothetical protein
MVDSVASPFGTAAVEQLVVWLYVAIGLRLLWHTGWRHGAKVLSPARCVVVHCPELANSYRRFGLRSLVLL